MISGGTDYVCLHTTDQGGAFDVAWARRQRDFSYLRSQEGSREVYDVFFLQKRGRAGVREGPQVQTLMTVEVE